MNIVAIENRIFEIRGFKVMLDFDLAELYEVSTKSLNQTVKRNQNRFPNDFMFQITILELEGLKSSLLFSASNRSQFVTGSLKHRSNQVLPYAFTEQGVAMLSGLLKSEKAVNVNIAIMRTFILLRKFALSQKELTEKILAFEDKYNRQFKDVYEALNYLLQKDKVEDSQKKRRRIGFK